MFWEESEGAYVQDVCTVASTFAMQIVAFCITQVMCVCDGIEYHAVPNMMSPCATPLSVFCLYLVTDELSVTQCPVDNREVRDNDDRRSVCIGWESM